MKKVLFLTNYPSPYRVEFFNQLGNKNVDLTVLFTEKVENQKHREEAWFNTNYKNFKALFCEKKKYFFGKVYYPDVLHIVNKNFDCIIFGGYANPSFALAMEILRIKKRPFIMEIDGGLIKSDSFFSGIIKKHLISRASEWLSSGDEPDKYLMHYGARRNKIYRYPFSSLTKDDLKQGVSLYLQKDRLRKKLEIDSNKNILFVGQFIKRKGIDIVLEVAKSLPDDINIIMIGGAPTDEMKLYCEENNIKNIIFPGFKIKRELYEFYAACDVLIMPTRYDIWGLVVNEALAHGLPIVSSDKCVAALELIENGVNGYIVKSEEVSGYKDAITKVLNSPREMGQEALNAIEHYTIEDMVEAHISIINKD